MIPLITYERDGVVIMVDENTVCVKKNGLTIEIPFWMLEDFANELHVESATVLKDIRSVYDQD